MATSSKRCNGCKAHKPRDTFSKAKGRSDGLDQYCKECRAVKRSLRKGKTSEYNKRYARENPHVRKAWVDRNRDKYAAQARAWRLAREYGLTTEEYNEMVEKQLSTCPLCLKPLYGQVVDHDHDTGKVRAVLCRMCNLGLGSFYDDPEAMRRAAEYVEHHRSFADAKDSS